MKKVFFTLIALIFSVTSYAQLIANKTDKKFTVNLDFFNDFQLSTNDNWDARMFNQGFSTALTYNFPLGESKKHTVSIGLGYSGHNYFSYSRIMNPYTTDTLVFQQYRDVDGFKRNKLNCNYIEMPFEVRFRIKDAWKIGIGFKVGVLVNAKTKFVGNNLPQHRVLSSLHRRQRHEKLRADTWCEARGALCLFRHLACGIQMGESLCGHAVGSGLRRGS